MTFWGTINIPPSSFFLLHSPTSSSFIFFHHHSPLILSAHSLLRAPRRSFSSSLRLLAMPENKSESFPRSSPLKAAREVMNSEMQGIGTILRSDCERFRVSPSLRRTLSADMSSKKWLSSIKKIASSAEISDSSSEDEALDERRGELDIWEEIQVKKVEKAKKPEQLEIWSSILSQNVDDESKSLPPYIHPLVKTSSSSLSERSLEICTESLGSETGSDGFSSYPASDTGDVEDEKKELTEKEALTFSGEEWRPLKYNYRKPLSQSFPPPLSSLSRRDGDSIRMQSHRVNGRLVLEAVSVPSQSNFHAKRQDGRLVLSFICSDEFLDDNEDGKEDELEETFADSEEEEEEEDEEIDKNTNRIDEIETVTQQPLKFSTGLLNIHRLARSMNKSITGFSNMNGDWSNKAEESAEQPWIDPVAQSLPPRPQIARRVTLNIYEYPWKANPNGFNQGKNLYLIKQKSPPMKNNPVAVVSGRSGRRNEEEEKTVVSFANGCKQQPKRSPQFLEPRCIATS